MTRFDGRRDGHHDHDPDHWALLDELEAAEQERIDANLDFEHRHDPFLIFAGPASTSRRAPIGDQSSRPRSPQREASAAPPHPLPSGRGRTPLHKNGPGSAANADEANPRRIGAPK